MGSFSAKVRVWNPSSPEKVEELEAMVDAAPHFPGFTESDGSNSVQRH